jgi:hypothetical protein
MQQLRFQYPNDPVETDEASGPRGAGRTRDHQAPQEPRAPQEPSTPLAQRRPAFDFDLDPIGRPCDP